MAIVLAALVAVALFWPSRWYPSFHPRHNASHWEYWLASLASGPMVGATIGPDGRSVTPSYYEFEPGFAEAVNAEKTRLEAEGHFLPFAALLEDGGRMRSQVLLNFWGRDRKQWAAHPELTDFDPFEEGPMPWMAGSEVLFFHRDGSAAFSIEVEGGEGMFQPVPAFSEGLCAVPTGVRDSTTSFHAMAEDGTVYSPARELTGFGFVRPDGSWGIAPQFEDALPFREGLAAVKQDGRWGYIDPAGAFAIEPRYSSALSFSEGLAAVGDAGSPWGYIAPDGSWAIEPRFTSAGPFSEGLAPAAVNKARGGVSSTLYGYIGPDGSWTIEPRYYFAMPFSSGLAPVVLERHQMGLKDDYAYINPEGEVVIPGPFLYAMPFQAGEAMTMRRVSLARWLVSPGRSFPAMPWSTEVGTIYGIDEDFVDE